MEFSWSRLTRHYQYARKAAALHSCAHPPDDVYVDAIYAGMKEA